MEIVKVMSLFGSPKTLCAERVTYAQRVFQTGKRIKTPQTANLLLGEEERLVTLRRAKLQIGVQTTSTAGNNQNYQDEKKTHISTTSPPKKTEEPVASVSANPTTKS